MADSFLALDPLSPAHCDSYFKVLRRIQGVLDGAPSMKAALGKYGLELLERQIKALETIAAGYDVKFDTRLEARELHSLFMDNFNYLEKKLQAYRIETTEVFERLNARLAQKQYLPWFTDVGHAIRQRPMVLYPCIARELAMIPLRAGQMRPVIIANYEALRGAEPFAFEYALHALSEAYLNYYHDYIYLVKNLGPDFRKHAERVFEIYAEVDEKIAQHEAAQARQAEEKARALEDERDDDDDEVSSGPIRHTPSDTYYADDDYDSGMRFNCANGLPMQGDSMFDIMGNAYGTDYHHF